MSEAIDPLLLALFDDPDDELSRLLSELRWLILKHPVAAQAAVHALVREGRRFEDTDEGRSWCRRLARSELVRRGQTLWEISTMNMLDEHEGSILPSQLVDAFCRAVARHDLEPALARCHEPSIADEDA